MNTAPRASILLLLWSLFSLSPAAASPVKITIYHTNDIHGFVDPGAARMAGYYKAQPEPKLLVDAGDWFQGTPEGTLTRGEVMADIFNAVPYDAVTIGNHEFDFGAAVLRKLIKKIKVPVLSANIYDRKSGWRSSFGQPAIIKTVGGVKVGLFGLTTSRMGRLAIRKHIKGLEFRREIEEARRQVASLRRQGAQVIIAVTHIGFENPDRSSFEGDQSLAALVPGIALIVGGHSHTVLNKPLRDATHGTFIVQAGSKLRSIGRFVLTVDGDTGKVLSGEGSLIDLRRVRTPADPEVLAIVRRYQKTLAPIVDVRLALAPRKLKRFGRLESHLGNWITDCIRMESGADIALQNSGGIRDDMPAGKVTIRTLFNIMPFENRVVLLHVRGGVLRAILDASGGAGAVQLSGARVQYRRGRRKRGRRIVSIEVGGRPLEEKALYTVALPDFLVGRESSVPYELAESREESDELIRDMLATCARRQGTVRRPRGGRIIRR